MSATNTRWKLTIEYDGRPYHGWQRQNDVPSVQETIETAINKFCQRDIGITAAGRTDAGVHARGQVAHFDLDYGDRALDGYGLMKALNAHLMPAPISIVKAEQVSADFHARFSAVNKLYNYKIVNRTGFLALDRGFSWHVGRRLNVEAMHEAAQILIGKHDFSTFRDSECQAKSPIKTLDRLDVTATPCERSDGQVITIAAEGKSFIHHQVRNMTGSLKLVGDGKWSVNDFKNALEARDRTKGGPTAPSDGLYLMRVDY